MWKRCRVRTRGSLSYWEPVSDEDPSQGPAGYSRDGMGGDGRRQDASGIAVETVEEFSRHS